MKINAIFRYYRESLMACEFDMSLKKHDHILCLERKKMNWLYKPRTFTSIYLYVFPVC